MVILSLVFFVCILGALIYFFEKEKRWLWFQILELQSAMAQMGQLSHAPLRQDTILPAQFQIGEKPKILLLKLDHIGDIVLSIPAIRAIRQHWPDAEITFVGGTWAKQILEPENLVDIFVVCNLLQDRSGDRKQRQRILKLFKTDVRDATYALAVDLRVFGDTAYLLKWVTASFKVYAKTAASMNIEGLGVQLPIGHAAEKILFLVRKLGVLTPSSIPKIYLTDAEKNVANTYLEALGITEQDVCIGIHPFASTPTRSWGPKNFMDMATQLIEAYGVRCLFFVGNDVLVLEDNTTEAVRNRMHIVSGTSLRESAALMAVCRVVVGNDSGPIHLAAATGTRVVCVFGGMALASEWGPVTDKGEAIYVDLPCMRCLQSQCSHLTCLTSISVERVVTTVAKHLN